LEDYALLVGSIGLLLVLASVMYCSRNIDWRNGEQIAVEVQDDIRDFV